MKRVRISDPVTGLTFLRISSMRNCSNLRKLSLIKAVDTVL